MIKQVLQSFLFIPCHCLYIWYLKPFSRMPLRSIYLLLLFLILCFAQKISGSQLRLSTDFRRALQFDDVPIRSLYLLLSGETIQYRRIKDSVALSGKIRKCILFYKGFLGNIWQNSWGVGWLSLSITYISLTE